MKDIYFCEEEDDIIDLGNDFYFIFVRLLDFWVKE